MAEGNQSTDPSTNYTSFQQFLEQNYFHTQPQRAQPVVQEVQNVNHHVMQYSNNAYFPLNGSNLTPTAIEFVPRNNYYDSNGVGNYDMATALPLAQLNLNGNQSVNTAVNHRPPSNGHSSSRNSSRNDRRGRGAVPKQPRQPYPHAQSNWHQQQPPQMRRSQNDNGQRRCKENSARDNRHNRNQDPQHSHNGDKSNRAPNGDNYSNDTRNKQNCSPMPTHRTAKGRDRGFRNGGDAPKKRAPQEQNHNHRDTIQMPVDISQREKQIVEIDAGRLECLVCCEYIKPFQSIWNCGICYGILHLNCTIKWANSSKVDNGWRCPACQNITEEVPRDYLCFCKKQRNPQYNRNDVAHSCGDLCQRVNGCSHPCTLLCHPGACPTCQASVTRQCGCGKTSKIMQCFQDEEIVCEDGICKKMRGCGVHECGAKCHTGDCEECTEMAEHQCHCGRNKKEVPCNLENLQNMSFACTKNCGRKLNCKIHKCQITCHEGECRPCQLTTDMITTCPCGKRAVDTDERKSCTDPVPLCDAICQKPLSCGPPANPHRCSIKCHTGNCPPCTRTTNVKCRCGHMDQPIKCKLLTTRADDARCKKKCAKKRSCGKHKCNQECCIDLDHICPLPCPSQLSCGKHKCDRTCHPGHCLPCQRSSFQELQCECGAQVIYPPVPCGTKRPACDKPCRRRHVCDHDVLHNCHTAATCPPCMIQTAKWCFGHHEQRKTIPCSQESFSCGMPCNKPLACERHKCIKVCHDGACMAEGEVCRQNCPKPRATCGHKCNASCHGGTCPDTMCRETVEVMCPCGHRKQSRTCDDFASDYRRVATAKLASSLQDMQSGTSSGLKDIFGPIKLTNNKTLECNEECRVLERNRRLAIGLQIRNPDLPSKLQTKYSDFLRGWAKKDLLFISGIHNKLTELVKLAKESKQRSRSHSFPVMNREKRQVVHEMCAMFGVDSVAYDAEPQRNIVATAYKDRSWLPGMSIVEVMKRETGQRRVPLPSNAWAKNT